MSSGSGRRFKGFEAELEVRAVQYVSVFLIKIEQAYRMVEPGAVENGILDEKDGVVERERINDRCSYASARRAAGDDERVDPRADQDRRERTAVEHTGLGFANYDVALGRGNVLDYVVGARRSRE